MQKSTSWKANSCTVSHSPWMFTAVFTWTCDRCLSWTRRIQFIPSQFISLISVLIFTLKSAKWSVSFVFPTRIMYPCLSCQLFAKWPDHYFCHNFIIIINKGYKLQSFSCKNLAHILLLCHFWSKIWTPNVLLSTVLVANRKAEANELSGTMQFLYLMCT
jgi:hypothetical protein